MKKILIIVVILVVSLLFIDIPKYEELNNLAIIDAIGIENDNGMVKLILRELIPTKDDNGIEYNYVYYNSKADTVEEAYKKIKKSTKKRVYLDRCSYLILDNNYTDDVKKKLNIHPVVIYHRADSVIDFVKRIG